MGQPGTSGLGRPATLTNHVGDARGLDANPDVFALRGQTIGSLAEILSPM
jgi:hypothetical protein